MTTSQWARTLRCASVVMLLCCGAVFAARAAALPADFDFGDRVLESVGTVDEIPNGVITALAQGADGYLWIGTQGGLLRFDGYRFRRFRHQVDKPDSLGADFIFSLAVGRDGRVWIGHEVDGVSVLDPASERFTHYRHDPALRDGIGPGNIYAIAVDGAGGVYIAADDGLTRFDPARERFETIVLGARGPLPEPSERVRSLLVDRAGTLWIGTQDGVLRMRPGRRAAEHLLTRDGESLAGREVVSLMQDWDGQLWVGTREHGAARVEPETGVIRWIGREHERAGELSQSWINAMAQVSKDEIWLSRYGSGVALVDTGTLAVRHLLVHDPSVPDGLSFDAAGAFQVDPAGLLWVGSWGGGLQRHNPRNPGFRVLRHSAVRPGRLSYPNLLSVLELRDGRVLAGTTQTGIDIIARGQGVIGSYRAEANTPGALSDGVIGGIAEATDGTLWVGTFQSGVHRLGPGSTRFEHYTREHGLPTLQIEFVEFAQDGRLWVGTGDGLVRFDAAVNRFVDVLSADGKPPRTRFSDLAEETDGRLWFASASGLFTLDPGAERLRQFSHAPKDPTSLVGDVVANVAVDHLGRVWVNTNVGIDLYRRDESGREWFEHVSAQLGLAGESLGSNLLADSRGRLWTSTAMLDTETMQVHRLHRSDGLDIGTNWIGSAAVTRDGHLLYGGTTGLGVVAPERFRPWSHVPRVLITEVTVDGMSQPRAAIERRLQLTPGQTRFDVEFSASDFSAPAANRYAYRLLGNADGDNDSTWVEVDADHRHASFGNLWPGDYVLEIRASNRVGETSTEPARFAIEVLPKYWQRQGFVLAMLLLALLALVLLMRLVVRRYRRRAVVLQALVDERTAALREAYARVERAARTDPLTGLGNRRSLEAALPLLAEQVLGARGLSLQRRRLALILVDIDEFKQVNDQYGHSAGDRVIEAFAQLIQQQLREGDIGVRWGGEEFLIVAQVIDEGEALHCAERLRLAVAAHRFAIDGAEVLHRTCSIGFACLPFAPEARDALSWQHVLEIADAALFEAKHDGRNRVYGYRAAGPIGTDFIERFRAAGTEQRMLLPLRRITAATATNT